MLNDSLLALANLLTSALTAITGVGGGMILIGLIPFFVPAAAIVPVHGVTQLVSNATRAWFGRDALDFTYFWQFLAGSWLGTRLRHKIRLDWLEKILPYLLTLIALKLIVDIARRYFF